MNELTTEQLDTVDGGAFPIMGAVWVFYTLAGPAFALGAAHGVSRQIP